MLAGSTYTDTFNYGVYDGYFKSGSQITFTITGTIEPSDTFTFDKASKKPLKIADFSSGIDEIRLNDGYFEGLGHGTPDGAPITSKMFVANTEGEATGKKAQIVYETDTGKLFYDEDGKGDDAAIQFATLIGKPTLAHTDFEIF
jgi:serralysin